MCKKPLKKQSNGKWRHESKTNATPIYKITLNIFLN